MRYGDIIFVVLSAVAPALGQQSDPAPGNQGVVDQRVFQDALQKAMRKSLELSANSPLKRSLVNFGSSRPGRVLNLPPQVCAIPLLEVPATKDADKGILLKDGDASGDGKMIVPPAAPPCAANRGR